jgi:proteasome accessory factor B
VAKLDRLLNLTAALLETQVPLTAEELRERVPGYGEGSDSAFRRTFERDKDDLRELGVPVETVPVEHLDPPRSGYTIRRSDYELEDPGLDPDELAALHLAATTVQLEGLGVDAADEALRKLGGLPERPSTDTAALGAVPAPAPLAELFRAALERRVVTFDYGDATRTVRPHRLQFERGHWYLNGYDVDRAAVRSFRLDRFSGPPTSGAPDAFERPDDVAGVRLRPWEFGEGEPIAAEVLLDAEIAAVVRNEHPGLEVTEERPDRAVVVRLQVRSLTGLRNFVLGLLDRGELLGPDELRADLVAWLGSMADRAPA